MFYLSDQKPLKFGSVAINLLKPSELLSLILKKLLPK